MRRGERKMWRDLAEIADKVASSSNYAEEYMSRIEFTNKLNDIVKRSNWEIKVVRLTPFVR